jgi:hypothetical protein
MVIAIYLMNAFNLQILVHKQMVAIAMLNLSADFDTLDHPTLLSRLQYNFGICDKALHAVDKIILRRLCTVCGN